MSVMDVYIDAVSWIARRLGLINSKNYQLGRWTEDSRGRRCYKRNRLGMFVLGLMQSFGPLVALLAAAFGVWAIVSLVIPHWRIALPVIGLAWIAAVGVGAALADNRSY